MKKLFALFFVFILLATAVMAKDAGFTFVQLADTQLGFTNNNKDLKPEIDNFTKAVEQINKLKPAFVVISGDLLNNAHDPKQTRVFWDIAYKIDPKIHLYLVAGNHDIGSPTAENVQSYEKLFSKDHYSFSYDNSYFIVLDTNLIKEPDADPKLRDEQFKWFESELAAARAKNPDHIFVLTHHSWFLASPDENDEYFNISKTERQKYLELMKRYDVEYALAGHYHREAIAKDGKLNMITSSAVSRALGKDPVGLRVFRVTKVNVENTYYALDQVPEQIKTKR